MADPANSGFVTGLQQALAPWLTGANPSALDTSFGQVGGLRGLLDAMMQAAGPDTSQAREGAALQNAQALALRQAQQRQALAQGAMGIQRMQSLMPLLGPAFAAAYGAPSNASSASRGAQSGSGSPAAYGGSVASPTDAPPMIRATPQQLAAGGQPLTLPTMSAGPISGGGAPISASPDEAYQRLLAQYRLGALLPMVGMNGSGITKMADFQAANDPSLITARATAGNQLTQDMALMRQAQASGNPLAINAARMRYLTDSKLVNPSAWNNSLTLFGGLTPSMLGYSAANPQQGYQVIGGVASPMPGMLPTRQALAGAQARGAAQGQLEEVTDTQGNRYYVPKSALLGGNGGVQRSGSLPGGGTGFSSQAALGPSQESYLAGRGKESATYVNTLQEGADAATNANYALDQMIQDAQKVSLGPAAGFKEAYQRWAGGIAQAFGSNYVPQQLSSYQELDKYANQIAFAATRQMGSREAAQIVHLQMQSNPNKELTPQAFGDLALSMKAMNNYLIAKNQVIQSAARANGGDAMAAAAEWTRGVDPRVWDLTLSPAMGAKWAQTIGPAKIAAAYQYLSPDEQQSLLRNLPTSVLKDLQ